MVPEPMRHLATRLLLSVLLVQAAGAAHPASATEPEMIETLPAFSDASEVRSGDLQAECAELRDALKAYLPEGYRVIGERYFMLDGDAANWNALEKFLDGEVAAVNGRRETFNHHRAGHDPYAVWALNQAYTMHFALAMAHPPLPDGRRLVGYFSLSSD